MAGIKISLVDDRTGHACYEGNRIKINIINSRNPDLLVDKIYRVERIGLNCVILDDVECQPEEIISFTIVG